ncbi:MAG: radical SAM protein [Elusimicrobia bacterium HGW-Elusimicrobia-1]|jgi:TatD DNase family protein|nr:MAG: radical SAM protein [Elusimicrobia bacterium HGW-Elusimicrobia-1]
MTAVYPYKGALYVNLTNRCPCSCVYCIKNKWGWQFRGQDLKLEREPSASEVVDAVKKADAEAGTPYTEIVFCGYGEPFMRFDIMKVVAEELKKSGRRIRVNTTGLINTDGARELLPDIAGIVDGLSVSLNAATPEDYVRVNRPAAGISAYASVLDFIRRAVALGFDVTVTAVEFPGADIDGVKKTAEGLGAKFRPRPYLEEYEDR